MQDHDQRFKMLIQEFFEDFLHLFFTPWAERLDCSQVEWLDKEVFPDPPDGPRRVLDLVAKVPTREEIVGSQPGVPGQWLALVHVEIESPDKVASLRPRMFQSYVYLREKYALPVLPIGLYLKVGLNGIGLDVYEEHFWELRAVSFQYLYVGLPALDGVEYVQGTNWLGVALAALMRIPAERAAWLGAEALRRIADAPLNDQRRYLLGECVQAYLALDARQQSEFEKLTSSEGFQKVKAMNTTWFEKGVEKGREVGREEGRLSLLIELLEDRFGTLRTDVIEKLHKLDMAELANLRKRLFTAHSLEGTWTVVG